MWPDRCAPESPAPAPEIVSPLPSAGLFAWCAAEGRSAAPFRVGVSGGLTRVERSAARPPPFRSAGARQPRRSIGDAASPWVLQVYTNRHHLLIWFDQSIGLDGKAEAPSSLASI